MEKQVKLDLIDKIPFFANVHEQDKELLAELAYFKAYKPEDLVIEQGTLHMSLIFLINGQVSVLIDCNHVINFRGGGQPFGEMSFVNNDLASATIKSDTDSTFMVLDVDKINSLTEPIHFRLRMQIYHACAEVLARKLKSTNEIAKSYKEKFGTGKDIN